MPTIIAALSRALAPAIMAVALASLAHAGSYSIDPIRVYLGDDHRTEMLEVTNKGTEKIGLQLELMTWEMLDGGEERYTAANDLVVFPKIMELAPGQRRVVRVGARGPAPKDVERSYRLYFNELPPENHTDGLKMLVRTGVPVFVQPAEKALDPVIGTPTVVASMLTIPVANRGSIHMAVTTLTATGLDAQGQQVFSTDTSGWYILAGAARSFSLELPTTPCKQSTTVKIRLQLRGVASQHPGTEISVTPDMC